MKYISQVNKVLAGYLRSYGSVPTYVVPDTATPGGGGTAENKNIANFFYHQYYCYCYHHNDFY